MRTAYVFNFEKLKVWEETVKLAKIIYKLSLKFPVSEQYGLTSQVRRAVISISSNIAEGSVKTSKKDKIRFYEIAIGSLMETLSQLIIAEQLDFITIKDLEVARIQIENISRMMYALKNSQST